MATSHCAAGHFGCGGYEVRYSAPPVEEYVARLTERGAPADYIELQMMIYRVVRANVSALPNRSIRRLTGRPATTFAQFAEREKAVWASVPSS